MVYLVRRDEKGDVAGLVAFQDTVRDWYLVQLFLEEGYQRVDMAGYQQALHETIASRLEGSE